MKSRLFWVAALGIGLVPASHLVLAQTAPVVSTPQQSGDVRIRGGQSVWDDQNGVGRIQRDVRVTQDGEDFILYADEITYNRGKNQAVARGNIRVETRDSTIRGNSMFADFDKKILTLTENVSMSSYGEKDGIVAARRGRNGAQRKPSQLTCKRIDWNYEDRQAAISGSIVLKQQDRSGTCDLIQFDERQNIAFLQGNVRFKDDKGQLFRSPALTVFMDTNKVQTTRDTTIHIPRKQTAATPSATKAPAFTFQKEETIGEDQMRLFAITPAPLPTPRPETPETEPETAR